MIRRVLPTVLALMFCACNRSAAQEEMRYVHETDPLAAVKIEQWRDLKFGLLMHWGPYSQWGVVESWSICAEDEGWCVRPDSDYIRYKRNYEALQTTFDPKGFDPAAWATAARNAGMRYVVFTTKHHDGFSMFDTKLSDYKITSPRTPFHANPRANVTREIFGAFRDQGLWVGAYFSKPDWHSEFYWWPNFATPDRNVNYEIARYPRRWEQFVQFTHGQLNELMADYGRIDILWLDGGWVRTHAPGELDRMRADPAYRFQRLQDQDIRLDELVPQLRVKQPGLIVVDRAVPGKHQNYLTPENTVPKDVILDPWESCIISGGGWSWTPNAQYMSASRAITMLVDIVAKGGNLLLNVAPGPDGTWDRGAVALLDSIGQWMAVNSEAIYGTRPKAPYKTGAVRYTAKGDSATFVLVGTEDGVGSPGGEVMLPAAMVPMGTRVSILGTNVLPTVERKGTTVLVRPAKRSGVRTAGAPVWVVKLAMQR